MVTPNRARIAMRKVFSGFVSFCISGAGAPFIIQRFYPKVPAGRAHAGFIPLACHAPSALLPSVSRMTVPAHDSPLSAERIVTLLARLGEVLPPDRLLSNSAQLAAYESDG